ncbi:MAG: AmmeMemoRadiSam system protein B, partial [Candidatus Aminicenantes bacterium]|nr:AmmeMemoRadiSam system protein B [Candidatus Aminicenantes bacterium]
MTKKKLTTSTLIIISIIFSFPLFCADDTNRNYLTTGNWYPSDKNNLDKILNRCFMNAKTRDIPGKIVGIIAPHAGIEYCGRCSASAYKQLIARADNIERVIFLGVSHRGGFYGACVSNFAYSSTPLGKVPEDHSITAALAKEKNFRVENRIMQYEHSIENHLPFLQEALGNRKYKIVPILFGYL